MAFEQSKFIWVKDLALPDSYGEFFSEISLSDKNVKIRISVDGEYTLFVNGAYVKSNQYGDFEHYKIYDEIDLSPFVHEGVNSIGITVWHFGESSQRYKAYAPGVIFEVLENGAVVLASDENVLSRKSKAYLSGRRKKISGQLGFTYAYDGTKKDDFPSFLGDGFKKSVVSEKDCSFFPRPIKFHSLLALKEGSLIRKNENNTEFLFDLGEECVGLLDIFIKCEDDTDIIIGYGECLDGGHIKLNLGDRYFGIDYKAPKGISEHKSYMLRLACRYLEVFSKKPVEITKIGIIPCSYGAKRIPRDFKNPLDKKIYDICVNTLDACMMEHYVDCPWREQCLYAFDSRNQMLAGYLAYENGNREYARANLRLISKDRRDDGLLSICFPSGTELSIPSFSLYYIIALSEYLDFTNDTDFIFEVNSKICEILDAFVGRIKNGLVYKLPGEMLWNFYDWSEGLSGRLFQDEGEGVDCILSMLMIYALEKYEQICERCNLSFKYDGIATAIRKSVKDTFFDTEKGLFRFDNSDPPLYHSLPNSFAVLLDLVSPIEAEKIASYIMNGEIFRPSLSMKVFEYDALIKSNPENMRFVIDEIRKSYGAMLDFGSSTVWETENGDKDFDNAGSLCHGWSAIAIKYLMPDGSETN